MAEVVRSKDMNGKLNSLVSSLATHEFIKFASSAVFDNNRDNILRKYNIPNIADTRQTRKELLGKFKNNETLYKALKEKFNEELEALIKQNKSDPSIHTYKFSIDRTKVSDIELEKILLNSGLDSKFFTDITIDIVNNDKILVDANKTAFYEYKREVSSIEIKNPNSYIDRTKPGTHTFVNIQTDNKTDSARYIINNRSAPSQYSQQM